MKKECKCCGKVFNELPPNFKTWVDDELKLVGKPHIVGFLWECECKSTLFIKAKDFINELPEEAK